MVVSHLRSRRQPTGAIYKKARGRRLAELGTESTLTKVGEKKSKVLRTRGGNIKKKLQSTNICNLYNTKSKKYEQADIENVVDSPADINYTRRNIMVKGTIIQTSKGKARVTSRPGQDGVLNAVMIE